jgi:hypothetical protein
VGLVSMSRVFESGLNTDGGAARMVHMSSSRRLRQDEAEDERINVMSSVRPC